MMGFNRNRAQVFTSKCSPSAMSSSPRCSSSSRYHDVNKNEVKSNNTSDFYSFFTFRYFSPSLQEDVFQHVSADTMLLHGVDTSQLAESLQFQAALLQDHSQNLSLEDYQSSNSQDLQAVLNSPLPDNLTDFASYGSSHDHNSPKDFSANKDLKDLAQYVDSPHPSPLPSPISQHDSPSFAYPTPPASQEGHSPSFGQSMLSASESDGFGASRGSVNSSPLFMSSAAAVEEALSQVLPMDPSGRINLYQSPSPPLALSVPSSTSTVSAPIVQSSFTTSQNHQFSLSPQPTLQSQMMPNSEDPLLSSSPKDFATKKRFDFNGFHSFKLLGNGIVDLGNGGLGIVIDNNGELKIVQATAAMPAHSVHSKAPHTKGIVLTTTAHSSVTSLTGISHSSHSHHTPQPKSIQHLLVPTTAYFNSPMPSFVKKVRIICYLCFLIQ